MKYLMTEAEFQASIVRDAATLSDHVKNDAWDKIDTLMKILPDRALISLLVLLDITPEQRMKFARRYCKVAP